MKQRSTVILWRAGPFGLPQAVKALSADEKRVVLAPGEGWHPTRSPKYKRHGAVYSFFGTELEALLHLREKDKAPRQGLLERIAELDGEA